MEEHPSQEPQIAPSSAESATGPVAGEESDSTQTEVTSPESVLAGEIERLRADLERKNQEVQELTDKFLRTYAELENFKKRVAKDQADWIKYANEGLLRELLTVLDNLSRARAHGEQSPEVSQWLEGVSLTIRQFEDILAKFGVTPIKTLGVPFDPSVHQAMSQVESEAEEGTVVEELQRGYLLHDRVLRPSLVSVAKKKRSEDMKEKGGHHG